MFHKHSDRRANHPFFSLDALERRVLLSGDLDPTFGFGGLARGPGVSDAIIAPTIPTSYAAVTTSSDRKVIVGGIANSASGGPEYYFNRFNADGSLDASFGTQGVTAISFGSLQAHDDSADPSIDLKLMIESDGKIIAAGNLGDDAGVNTDATAFGVARLNSNGTLDTTFGNGGTLVFQGDQNPWLMWQNSELLIGSNNTIRRFNDNGTIDSTFATGLPGGAAFAVQSDGKIVEGLDLSITDNGYTNTAIRRFNSDGTIDSTFGSSGIATSAQSAGFVDMIVETDGTIVTLVDSTADVTPGYVLEALNSNGSTDIAFGSDGVASTQTTGDYTRFGMLIQQPNGQLLLTMTFGYGFSYSDAAQVQRYSAEGQLDTSFGNDGSTQVGSFGEKYDISGNVSIQSIAALDNAGRLLLVGGSESQNHLVTANIVGIQTLTAAAPGPATIMLIQEQPTNVYINTNGTSTAVALEDANGALAIGDTSTFTIFLSGGTAGATIQPAPLTFTSIGAHDGFVPFGPFQIDMPGIGYTFTISGPETPSLTTAPFDVVAPEVFAQQPSGAVPVGKLAPVVVDILNINGDIDTTNNSNVILSVYGGPQNSTLDGTTTVAAVNGVATFNDLSITTPGNGYMLTTGVASSNPFNVGLFHLEFATQPSSVTSAGSLGTVAVDLLDSDGNVVTSDNSNVTLALASGPAGAVLGGTTTIAAVNGVATFSDLALSAVGNNYTLTATTDNSLSASSSPFNVVPKTTPSTLVPSLGKVQLPAQVIAGTKFSAKSQVFFSNHSRAAFKKGVVTIAIFADTGTILDGEQVLVKSTKKKVGFKADSTLMISVSITSLPATLAAGTYHLLAELIDPTGATGTTATTQTVVVLAPVIQPAITVDTVMPLVIPSKHFGTVWLTVTNQGNVPAHGVEITLSPSANGVTPVPGVILTSTKSNATIQPKAIKRFKLRFKANSSLTAGIYYPYASISLDGVSATAVGTTAFTVG